MIMPRKPQIKSLLELARSFLFYLMEVREVGQKQKKVSQVNNDTPKSLFALYWGLLSHSYRILIFFGVGRKSRIFSK